jgi:hypothetical protein
VGAGLVHDQVEKLAGVLVLHHPVARSDQAQRLAFPGLGVDAGGGEPVGHLGAGLDRAQGLGSDVPAAEVGDLHHLGGGQAFGGHGPELVPGVLAGGEEGSPPVGELLQFVCHFGSSFVHLMNDSRGVSAGFGSRSGPAVGVRGVGLGVRVWGGARGRGSGDERTVGSWGGDAAWCAGATARRTAGETAPFEGWCGVPG